MNKIKNLWANNRILFILGVILFVCVIAIIVVVMTYFMGAKKSVYGNRFDNMKTHIKKAEQKAYTSALEERSGVEKVSLRVNNKTLMISVTVKDDIKLERALVCRKFGNKVINYSEFVTIPDACDLVDSRPIPDKPMHLFLTNGVTEMDTQIWQDIAHSYVDDFKSTSFKSFDCTHYEIIEKESEQMSQDIKEFINKMG
jgi:hypothetical protein